MRRYRRNIDPYQVEENLLELIGKMQIAVFPEGVGFKDFKKLLYAVQYHERKPQTNHKAGRRRKFTVDFLTDSAAKLKSILFNQTNGRISLLRFISTYLPILDYPKDIRTALNKHEINLAEARNLDRLNSKNIGNKFKSKPATIRREILENHLNRKDTQAELARRVAQKLSTMPKVEAAQVSTEVLELEYRNDEFLEFSEFDTAHLLWEEIKGLVFLARELEMNLFSEEQTIEILNDLDTLKLKIGKFGNVNEDRIIKF